MKQRFEIPYKPDSVNGHWKIARGGKRKILSDEGREFRDKVQWFLKSKGYKTFKGRLKIKVNLFFADNRIRDIDNYFKSIFDCLKGFLFVDDDQICELEATKKTGAEKDFFIIEVEELNEF